MGRKTRRWRTYRVIAAEEYSVPAARARAPLHLLPMACLPTAACVFPGPTLSRSRDTLALA